MRILYSETVGTESIDHGLCEALLAAHRPETGLGPVALPPDRPQRLEYHSREAPVAAPCQAARAIAAMPGNRFPVLVGRHKWIPKMRENGQLYGHGEGLACMRPPGLDLRDFQVAHALTSKHLPEAGRAAIEALPAPLKFAEMLAEGAMRFGWQPLRLGGSDAPPRAEVLASGYFGAAPSIGQRLEREPQPA